MMASEVNYIQQPKNSRLCGQSCVAMASGLTLEQAIELFGHRHGTTTKDLVRVLRENEVPCDSRLRVIRRNIIPARSILKVQFDVPGRKTPAWHWVLAWDGEIHDPAGPDPRYPKETYITAALNLDLTSEEEAPGPILIAYEA